MVVYQKLSSRRYEMDTVRLMTWNMDIRDMFYDLILKDIMDEEDTKFFSVVKAITGDKPEDKGKVYEDTGAARWMDCGAFSRDAFAFFSKALMSNKFKLNPGMYLMNNVTARTSSVSTVMRLVVTLPRNPSLVRSPLTRSTMSS
jgi:hypothetical protein